MRRRELLQGLSTVALSQLIIGCQSGNTTALQVYLLKNALPPQLLRKARRATEASPQLKLKEGLTGLFGQLQTWHDSKSTLAGPRLVSLGDYWLAPAIQQNLIEPLDPQQLSRWAALPSRWQELVTRDRNGLLTPSGPVWGAPYRWGMTLLAYRRDKFKPLGWTPEDWSDLWRPEIKHRFSLPDQAREVIGLTLKTLGQSYNTENPAQLEPLLPKLKDLHQQTKFYSSTDYLQPLILGDTWAAVGWSTDLLPILAREPQIQVVAPVSGTALWADLWVQAASTKTETPAAVNNWIDFWWQAKIADDLSQFTDALSPTLQAFSADQSLLSSLLVDNAVYDNSECLTPVPISTLKQFQTLWQQMRTP